MVKKPYFSVLHINRSDEYQANNNCPLLVGLLILPARSTRKEGFAPQSQHFTGDRVHRYPISFPLVLGIAKIFQIPFI